jgi:hypothetical protein
MGHQSVLETYLHCAECKRDYEEKKCKPIVSYPSGNAKETYCIIVFKCPQGHTARSIRRDIKGYYALVEGKKIKKVKPIGCITPVNLKPKKKERKQDGDKSSVGKRSSQSSRPKKPSV